MELNNWIRGKLYKLVDWRGVVKTVSLGVHGDSLQHPLIPYIDRTHTRSDGVTLGHFYVCEGEICFPVVGKNSTGTWVIEELEEIC